jgi:hypothetical protein
MDEIELRDQIFRLPQRKSCNSYGFNRSILRHWVEGHQMKTVRYRYRNDIQMWLSMLKEKEFLGHPTLGASILYLFVI